MKTIARSLFVLSLLMIVSCSKSGDKNPAGPQNHAPIIQSVVASPDTIPLNGTTYLTCLASDADGDSLTYSWSATQGTFPQGASSSTVQWSAGNLAGLKQITVTVHDGKESVLNSVSVFVLSNNSPVIQSVTATPDTVTLSSTAQLVCSASDADHDPLTYQWSCPSGTFPFGSAQANAQWQAPATSGTYTLTISVSDGQASVQGSTRIFVLPQQNRAPVIGGERYPTNNGTEISVDTKVAWTASDPDGDPLTYDVYFGTTNPPAVYLTVISVDSQAVGHLSYDTQYYWRVVAKDGRGGETSSSVLRFRTTVGTTVWSSSYNLPEDYYSPSDPISFSKTGALHIDFRLTSWPGDYNLELFVMSASEYTKYTNGNSFNVGWRVSVGATGTFHYDISSIPAGSYRIVLDNTDLGWESTDWDGTDDIAVYSATAYRRY